jgi:inhibitor of KinA
MKSFFDPAIRWCRYGRNGILVTFADKVSEKAAMRCRAIAEELDSRPLPGLVEYVPGFTSVLLEFNGVPASRLDETARLAVERLAKAARSNTPKTAIRDIPTRYNGPDLQRVADHAKLSVERVVKIHSGAVYRVFTLGFSPGFPYLGELDSRLHTPRLGNPRQKVEPGSVAIGGAHTGIYSVESPGGWNIIGRTDVKLFDPERAAAGGDEAMFLLKPGDRVRFVPVVDKK